VTCEPLDAAELQELALSYTVLHWSFSVEN